MYEDYEHNEVMIDSGASETVASEGMFDTYPLEKTTATGTTYSSAAAKQSEEIVNLGQTYVQVTDERGGETWATFLKYAEDLDQTESLAVSAGSCKRETQWYSSHRKLGATSKIMQTVTEFI